MTPDFDLVIVDGSFAGLVCARTVAMRGLRVAVIDRKRDPGAQVRTTGIPVKQAADVLDLPSGVSRKVRGVRIYAPSGRHRDLGSDGYYFLATDTAALLRCSPSMTLALRVFPPFISIRWNGPGTWPIFALQLQYARGEPASAGCSPAKVSTWHSSWVLRNSSRE